MDQQAGPLPAAFAAGELVAVMKRTDVSHLESLVDFFACAAADMKKGNQAGALEHLESAAFWLERRGEHLALAEQLLGYVLCKEPTRRRQQLLIRVLSRMGRDREVASLEKRLLPRTVDDEVTFQRLRRQFLDWLRAQEAEADDSEDV